MTSIAPPTVSQAEATQIAIRLPVPLLHSIDQRAAEVGLNRASWIRMTLTAAAKPIASHPATEGGSHAA
jgi:hypothetical protein